ncbi:hypothetical protein [Streptomyces hirsutus]|uniref:hypothetical protein n=1 Tax=Streptomyces hirsutus TaxID=35620 RepID=UPI00331BECA4
MVVVADAAETRLCAWLSVSTFAGLPAFALFGWTRSPGRRIRHAEVLVPSP